MKYYKVHNLNVVYIVNAMVNKIMTVILCFQTGGYKLELWTETREERQFKLFNLK